MTARTRVAFHAALATVGAATALSAVFDGYGWLWPVVGGIAVVAVVSELVRHSPLPAALGPLLAAAAVTCYITALYAGRDAYWHVVPSTQSFTVLRHAARNGFSDVRALATPVPTHRGLVLITVVALAAVALVVDLLAVTMRRAALAGLPLLAVFALCTSVAKHGAGWIPFVLASATFLWLLLADSRDRLSRWGRSLGFDHEARPRFSWSDDEVMPSPLSVLGRRIGLTAIVIGVAVPVLVPGLRGGVPKGGGSGFGDGGSSSVQTINPIVTLRNALNSEQATPVLRVTSTAESPPYLRLTSLDRFDGSTFSPSPLTAKSQARVENGIQAPHPQGPTVKTTVQVANLAVHWLPLPAQVQSVSISGDWRFEPQANTVFSSRSDTRQLHYSAISITPNPSPDALRQVGGPDLSVTRYLDLPANLPDDIRRLTESVTRNAASPFDRALAIQNFLQSPPFKYDTTVPGTDSSNALDEFLRVTHRGFCQQYAAAMAVMARVANIPSRVAVGFTHGERQADGSWLVTTHDAHAWPELYFNGFGWLPFEPTPRADGQAVPPAFTQTQPVGGSGNGGGSDKTSKDKAGNQAPAVSKNQRLDNASDPRGVTVKPVATTTGHRTRDRLLWLALAVVVVLLASPSVARVVTRRRRWSRASTAVERADAAWAELRASAIDARTGWLDGLTPQATARVLHAEAGGLMAGELRSLGRLVSAVQRAWYAADPGTPSVDTLRSDVDLLRVAFMSESTAAERFVMRAWPRSTMRAAREGLTRLTELLDSLDLAGARLRARLRPHPTHVQERAIPAQR